jgi:hypothetical protein
MEEYPSLPIIPPNLFAPQVSIGFPKLAQPTVPSGLQIELRPFVAHDTASAPSLAEQLEELARQFGNALGEVVYAMWKALQAWARRMWRFLSRALRAIFRLCPRRRRRPRPRNTRVRMVQAKRKQLDLSPDGKCCGLRSRRASYAFRREEQRDAAGLRQAPPNPRDFERVPARRRKKEIRESRRRSMRWLPVPLSEQELAWMETMERIRQAVGISF